MEWLRLEEESALRVFRRPSRLQIEPSEQPIVTAPVDCKSGMVNERGVVTGISYVSGEGRAWGGADAHLSGSQQTRGAPQQQRHGGSSGRGATDRRALRPRPIDRTTGNVRHARLKVAKTRPPTSINAISRARIHNYYICLSINQFFHLQLLYNRFYDLHS